MKLKEIDFSAYEYKRICIEETNLTYYPANVEELILKMHGEKEIDTISVNEFGWLFIHIQGAEIIS